MGFNHIVKWLKVREHACSLLNLRRAGSAAVHRPLAPHRLETQLLFPLHCILHLSIFSDSVHVTLFVLSCHWLSNILLTRSAKSYLQESWPRFGCQLSYTWCKTQVSLHVVLSCCLVVVTCCTGTVTLLTTSCSLVFTTRNPNSVVDIYQGAPSWQWSRLVI